MPKAGDIVYEPHTRSGEIEFIAANLPQITKGTTNKIEGTAGGSDIRIYKCGPVTRIDIKPKGMRV